MPEGHSIHRLARQFQDVFAGHRLASSSPQGRFDAGAALLDGLVLRRATAHGKQLFLEFGPGAILRVHLGLYGAWSFGGDETFAGASSIGAPRRMGELDGAPVESAGYSGPPAPTGAVRIRLVSAHGWADLRGAAACEVITAAEAAAVVARLGPDPLINEPGNASEFVRRLQSRRTAVAVSLMNQEVLAGVGNVYRAELLFRRRINPSLPGSALGAERALQLWEDTVTLMADGLRDGRIITTAAAHRQGGNWPPAEQDAHYVYKRNGLPCRLCGTVIRHAEVAGRKLYWCPGCQE